MLRKPLFFFYLMMKIILGPVYCKPFISLRHRFVTCYRLHYKNIRKRYAIQSTRGLLSAFSDAAISSKPCVRWPLSAFSDAAISLRICASGATVSDAQRNILVFTSTLTTPRARRENRSSVRLLIVWGRRAFISLRHHPVTTTTDDVRHSICKGLDRLLCLDVTLEITHGVIRSRK